VPNGNSQLAVYGIATEPYTEYYVADAWGVYSWSTGGKRLGNFTSDGVTYTVVVTTRFVNISGVRTPVQQIFSDSYRRRVGGTVTLANHFKAWESFGYPLGKLGWQIVYVEGYYSGGSANITVEGP
jgi:endo-1,4-beta-xylanase